MMKTQKAFTLIELLVVVAIIAVLVAVLLPVLNAAKEKARGVTCIGNLKQLGLAFLIYESDYGRLPSSPGGSGWPSSLANAAWDWQIYPYVKSPGLFKCPDDVYAGSTKSYGISGSNCWSNPANNNDIRGRRLNEFPDVSNTILVAELYDLHLFAGEYNGGLGFPVYPCFVISVNPHNGGGNYLFVDGHAAWSMEPVIIARMWTRAAD